MPGTLYEQCCSIVRYFVRFGTRQDDGGQAKITLMLDNDQAGASGTEKCIEALVGRFYVKAVRLPNDVAQPDELANEEIYNLLEG